jgi:uncharacterized protein YjiS (DUF1127 family)
MDSAWTQSAFPLPDAEQLRCYPSRTLMRLWFDVVLALPAATLAVLRAWRTRLRERQELYGLDGRTLQDIGVTVNERDRELRKPFWEE